MRARAVVSLKIWRYKISRFRPDPRKQRKLIPSKISRYTVLLAAMDTTEQNEREQEVSVYCIQTLCNPIYRVLRELERKVAGLVEGKEVEA